MKTFDELLKKAKSRGYRPLVDEKLIGAEIACFADGILLYPQLTETLLIGYWVQVHSRKRIYILDKQLKEISEEEQQELIDQLYDLLDEWPVIDKI
jgi:hypothetical protein